MTHLVNCGVIVLRRGTGAWLFHLDGSEISTKPALQPFAIGWVTDTHLLPNYSANSSPLDLCVEKGEFNTMPPNYIPDMETDLGLGRAGCPSPPRLVDETFQFLQGLVTQSRKTADARKGHLESVEESSDAAAVAFRDYPLPPIETLFLTGDFINHPRRAVDYEQMESDMVEAAKIVFERFPQRSHDEQGPNESKEAGQKTAEDVQIVIVVGNHEFPLKCVLPRNRRSWAEVLYKIWRPALPGDSKTREVRVLCLNTNMYFKWLIDTAKKEFEKSIDSTLRRAQAAELAADSADPAGQFAWLEEELRTSRSLGQQVIIVSHIAPGVFVRFATTLEVRNYWDGAYAVRYSELISAYSDIVVAQVFGHVHVGYVRALLPPGAEAVEAAAAAATGGPGCSPRKPNLPTAILTGPSVSPINGNNPAIRVLLFEPRTEKPAQSQEGGQGAAETVAYSLADYAQYHLPLYGFVGASGFRGAVPVFRFEHSFQDTFKPFMRCAKPVQPGGNGPPRCIDGLAALQLADAMRRSPTAFTLYQSHGIAGGNEVPSTALICSSVTFTQEDALKCINKKEQ